MAVMHSEGLPIGTAAPAFSLPGVDGRNYTLNTFRDAKVLVVVFTCNHCPYAKASEDRLIAVQRDYASRGVQVVAINPNDAKTHPEDSLDNMKARAEAKKFGFPYLRDESQQIAKAYNAVCTPDIYVFDHKRELAYNGRLDDNWQDPSKVARHDLRIVLDSLLEGRPIPFEPVASVGCSIKWKG